MESHGNPLALIELPRTWGATELAIGFGHPGAQPLAGKLEQSYARRVRALPVDAQLLVVAAAAEPLGDLEMMRRAAGFLGVAMSAVEPALDAGLIAITERVTFAHPLARSAAYRSAAAGDRHRVHRALADATDARSDPDRRAWHRAAAAVKPDEQVALELELSAERAQSRGGLVAAAAFLQRAVALTDEPRRRTGRALSAAEASLGSGAFEVAYKMLAIADEGPVVELERARVQLLRAKLTYAESHGSDASPLLLQAAQELETLDVRLARDTYLEAWGAALFAGGLAAAGGTLLDVSRAAVTAPKPVDELPRDLLLDGLALILTHGRGVATPVLRQALSAFASSEVSAEDMLRWGWLATRAANLLWDQESALGIGRRSVEAARALGALEALAVTNNAYGQACVFAGDFATASLLAAEVDSVKEVTGTRIASHVNLALAGLRGQEVESSSLIEAILAEASSAGQGSAMQYARWANAVLMNGLGRYDDALPSAVHASEDAPQNHIMMWALSELVEAAVRIDDREAAEQGLARLGTHTEDSDADWGLGIRARSEALLREGDAAEKSYREAIERLRRTPLRPEVARTHLLFGEWLRRQGRRIDAREHLRTAHDMLTTIGMEAFAERARRELVATGEKVRKRSEETRNQLTPQEEQIARLARDGLSNPEIGAQLFISGRTVEWHLRKIFAKLGINSRRQLRTALPERAPFVPTG
jgi:DNA-binding CsgD family transcriptional regulator/tetratricopeptide (TPR) repeat protein